MTERRQWPRIEANLKILLRLKTKDDLFQRFYLSDISVGGMFVRTDETRPRGTPVAVRIEFADGGVFEAEGEVRHAVRPEMSEALGRPAGIGIKFTAMGEASRQLLESLIEAL